jgi:hypothetical protein
MYRQKLKAASGGEDGAPEVVHTAATNTDATNADIVAQKDAVGVFKSQKKKNVLKSPKKMWVWVWVGV